MQGHALASLFALLYGKAFFVGDCLDLPCIEMQFTHFVWGYMSRQAAFSLPVGGGECTLLDMTAVAPCKDDLVMPFAYFLGTHV